MLRWLTSKPKNDPYNKAVDLFQGLRYLPPFGPQYYASLLEIIRLCQQVIQRRPGDGDAHILLANAFMIADVAGPVRDFSFVRGAAAIHHWKTVPMYSKERANGNTLYDGVQGQLAGNADLLPAECRNRTLAQLHLQYYSSAISPSSADELARLIDEER